MVDLVASVHQWLAATHVHARLRNTIKLDSPHEKRFLKYAHVFAIKMPEGFRQQISGEEAVHREGSSRAWPGRSQLVTNLEQLPFLLI